MKVNREPRPIDDRSAIHVWSPKFYSPGCVGIAIGPLFDLVPAAEARELANALYEAADAVTGKTEKEAV